MNEIVGIFNNKPVTLTYNEETGYYETELIAPETGGIYEIDVTFTDLLGGKYTKTENVQIFAKEKLKIETEKVFMWILNGKDFSTKGIVEIFDYEINIDEETNATSIVSVLKNTTAKAKDIVAIKKNNEDIYWGIIDKIENNDGENLYRFSLKYITNLFNQNIKLENQNLISDNGIEDFIENAISKNFINNEDTFVNLTYLEIVVKTHTKKQISVSNVNNNIYNLHTWMTNCTQKYEIIYSFNIANNKLQMTIEIKALEKELIDINAQPISNYTEVFETDVVSKVIVLTDSDTYTLYLLNDRTTTTDRTNKNRAEGRTEMVYTANFEDARQVALDVMKSNSYNHNITFSYNKIIAIGTPIAIKTKKSIIYDTYISAIKITQSNFIQYTCGNIRTKFIDKLLKERNS